MKHIQKDKQKYSCKTCTYWQMNAEGCTKNCTDWIPSILDISIEKLYCYVDCKPLVSIWNNHSKTCPPRIDRQRLATKDIPIEVIHLPGSKKPSRFWILKHIQKDKQKYSCKKCTYWQMNTEGCTKNGTDWIHSILDIKDWFCSLVLRRGHVAYFSCLSLSLSHSAFAMFIL